MAEGTKVETGRFVPRVAAWTLMVWAVATALEALT